MKTDSVDTVSRVAKALGIPSRTLGCACDRGEIKLRELACGTAVVALADVERWIKTPRSSGRPRQ